MHFLVRLCSVYFAVVSACGFLAVSSPEARTQNITFTNIADTSTFKFFETVPVVNSAEPSRLLVPLKEPLEQAFIPPPTLTLFTSS